mgnify:CR=1 FL=1
MPSSNTQGIQVQLQFSEVTVTCAAVLAIFSHNELCIAFFVIGCLSAIFRGLINWAKYDQKRKADEKHTDDLRKILASASVSPLSSFNPNSAVKH